MKTILLKTYENSFEANLLKTRLENEDIDCFLTNENTANLLPHHFIDSNSGIQIFIDENDRDKALVILKKVDDKDPQIVSCPQCGSMDISNSLGKNKIKKVFQLFFALFAGTMKNSHFFYLCKNCNTEFQQLHHK